MQIDDEATMKEKLLETVSELRKAGIDLGETPALFQWVYDEEPDILMQLMIKELDETPETETLQ